MDIPTILAFQYPTAIPQIDYQVTQLSGNQFISLWNLAFGPQPTDLQLTTIAASAAYQTYITPAATDQRQRDSDASKIDTDHSAIGRAIRASAAVLVDELNILRALHGLSNRTLAQAKSAIQTKISTGVVD